MNIKSVAIDTDNETLVNIALQPNWNQPIEAQPEITLSYKAPKGDHIKNVIEDLLGNNSSSFNNISVDII